MHDSSQWVIPISRTYLHTPLLSIHAYLVVSISLLTIHTHYQVTRDQRQRVPARGTATTTAKANIQMSIAQLFAMGLDCIANDNLTKYVCACVYGRIGWKCSAGVLSVCM